MYLKKILFGLLIVLIPFISTGQRITSQEIRYVCDEAAEVFLVWGVNGWQSLPDSLKPQNTKINNGLYYTPMTRENGIHKTVISVPEGFEINMNFWITKSPDGNLMDLWDTYQGKGYHARAGDPIVTFEAHLTPDTRSFVEKYGWTLALALLIPLGFAIILQRYFKIQNIYENYFMVIVMLLTLTYGLHIIIRFRLLEWSLTYLSPSSVGVATFDLLYLSVIAGIFLLAGLAVKSPRLRKGLLISFIAVMLLSTIFALANINIVRKLGHPFNYQWLYYSDFLGSSEAQSAILENLNKYIVLNMVLLVGTFFIFFYTLLIVGKIITTRSPAKPVHLVLLLLFVNISLGIIGYSKLPPVDNSKLKNPVVYFTNSLFDAQQESTLFTMEVSIPEQETPASNDSYYNPAVKNLVIIVLESAGAEYFDFMSGSDNNLTPRMAEELNNAAVFTNIYAHAPATNKSMVSILCSMYPWISYNTLTQEAPDLAQPSITSVLSDSGYRTSFLSSSDLGFQNSEEFLKNRGFNLISDFDDIPCSIQFKMDGFGDGYGIGIDDSCLPAELSNWIDEEPSSPFVSVLWTNQGHYPYFFDGVEKEYAANNIYKNKYLNIIEHYDAMVGAVLDSLETRNLLDSTLIVIVGDHGEAFGQHNQMGHGNGIYEENIHVPLMMINRNVFSGERYSNIGGLVDIAPTLFALAAIAIPNEWQGKNLLETNPANTTFFFSPWSDYLFGARTDNLKIIFNETSGNAECYDLEKDPYESTNIAAENPEVVEEFRKRVAAWVQGHSKFILNDKLSR